MRTHRTKSRPLGPAPISAAARATRALGSSPLSAAAGAARTLGLMLALATAAPAAAQHALAPEHGAADYDPAIPTPQTVLGWELGQRFTPHHVLLRYAQLVAAASPRIDLDTAAVTFEGRELLRIVATSEANQARIGEVRGLAARLADPRGAPEAELRAAVDRLPTIAWLGYSVHGNEASGVEAALGLLYQLAAGRDAETRMILDSVVVLIDPVQNPDGHERHVQDVLRRSAGTWTPPDPAAMVHAGTWPGARTSHYLFDLNRDWFIHSHPETRGRVATFLSWWPHVAVDLHEMGTNSTYFFAPPMEPVNENVDASIREWWDVFAAANAAAFDRHGWPYFTREGYDEFYPGYGVSWPILTGAVGMTYEQASSRGGRVRRSDGTILTLEEAARHHYTAAWATLLASASRRTGRVRDYLAFRQSAITEHADGPIRTVLFEDDARGRGDSLAARLLANGIEVGRLGDWARTRATPYGAAGATAVSLPAGTYVVDFAQPQGRLAKALLEPDARLDSAFIREELEARSAGQDGRFYDVTAWTLPYLFRVAAWHTPEALGGARPVTAATLVDAVAAAPAPARYGWAFDPGSDASLRLLAGLLADSVRVWYAPKAFTTGGAAFPHGAFVVRVAGNEDGVHATVARLATEAGAAVVALGGSLVDEGTDLGSNSVTYVPPPRVALLGGAPIGGYSHGFAWHAFDQRLRYPVTTVETGDVSASVLRGFDVVVVPSASPGALDRVLGESGRSALTAWVRAGGTLVTLDAATAWSAAESTALSRLRLKADAPAPDSAAGAPLPADVPGAIVRAVADTLSPLLAGIDAPELPVLVFSDRIYQAPADVRPGEVVIRYADDADRLRLAGYLWPEVPARLAGTPYLWSERVGHGRLIAFAGEPNFRAMWRGLLPLFFNAVTLGPGL